MPVEALGCRSAACSLQLWLRCVALLCAVPAVVARQGGENVVFLAWIGENREILPSTLHEWQPS